MGNKNCLPWNQKTLKHIEKMPPTKMATLLSFQVRTVSFRETCKLFSRLKFNHERLGKFNFINQPSTSGSSNIVTSVSMCQQVVTFRGLICKWPGPLSGEVGFSDGRKMLPGPSSLGAKWSRYRVSIHHPLGFKDGTPWKALVLFSQYQVIQAVTQLYPLFGGHLVRLSKRSRFHHKLAELPGNHGLAFFLFRDKFSNRKGSNFHMCFSMIN